MANVTSKLFPVAYDILSGASYVTVSDITNAYTPVDSETYATIRCTSSSSDNVTLIFSFNDDDTHIIMPDKVSTFNVKIKARFSTYISGYERSAHYTISATQAHVPSSFSLSDHTLTFDNKDVYGDTITWTQVLSRSGNPIVYLKFRPYNGMTISLYGIELNVTHEPIPKIFNLILPRG